MTDFFDNPSFKHTVFSPREMAMVCDVCNPGFAIEWPLGEAMVAQSLRLSVADSFRLHPGTYEKKWGIDRDAMLAKLAAMSVEDLVHAAHQVDGFWNRVTAASAAREFGRRGGLATRGISTPAKRRAARRNAKLGGRPRKNR